MDPITCNGFLLNIVCHMVEGDQEATPLQIQVDLYAEERRGDKTGR